MKGGLKRGVKRSSGPNSRVPGGDRVAVRVGVVEMGRGNDQIYSEALPIQRGYCVGDSPQTATGNSNQIKSNIRLSTRRIINPRDTSASGLINHKVRRRKYYNMRKHDHHKWLGGQSQKIDGQRSSSLFKRLAHRTHRGPCLSAP